MEEDLGKMEMVAMGRSPPCMAGWSLGQLWPLNGLASDGTLPHLLFPVCMQEPCSFLILPVLN